MNNKMKKEILTCIGSLISITSWGISVNRESLDIENKETLPTIYGHI